MVTVLVVVFVSVTVKVGRPGRPVRMVEGVSVTWPSTVLGAETKLERGFS